MAPKDKFGNIIYISPKDKYGNNKSYIMHAKEGFVPIKDGNWDTQDKSSNAIADYHKIK